ncbi:MAG: TonB family protein [Chthoniobacteraceae bacterium]
MFRRWLDAFVALPDRIKFPLAVLVALFLHGLVFMLAWLWPYVQMLLALVLPVPAPDLPTPTPQPKKLEVTLFTPTPTPEPKIVATPTPSKMAEKDEQLLKELFAQLPAEKQREYVDVEGLARKKNTSAKALLESWRDSVAGSRKRGTGSDPLPTLDGLEHMQFTQLTDREVSLGKPENPAAAQSDTSAIFKPKPVDPNVLAASTTPKTAEPALPRITPRPVPTSTPTPTPQPMLVAKATPPPNVLSVKEASADQIPVFLNRRSDPNAQKNLVAKQPEPDPDKKPTPQPTATPPPKQTPLVAAHPTPSPLPTPTPQDAPAKAATRPQSVIIAAKLDLRTNQPRPVPNPGYSPQMRRTRVNGMAMPEGEDGVDSVATPLGRFKKSVSSAVGSRWNYYIQKRMSLLQTGKVTVVFSLDARGKVRSFRIEENTSNSAHAALIEQCVREAEFDPPPPEALRNGVFEYPMSFHLL